MQVDRSRNVVGAVLAMIVGAAIICFIIYKWIGDQVGTTTSVFTEMVLRSVEEVAKEADPSSRKDAHLEAEPGNLIDSGRKEGELKPLYPAANTNQIGKESQSKE